MNQTEYLNQNARSAFETAETFLRDCIKYAGPSLLVDGTMFSPSDRALPGVESVYRDAYGCNDYSAWEDLLWALEDLYDALGLVWQDGCLYAHIETHDA